MNNPTCTQANYYFGDVVGFAITAIRQIVVDGQVRSTASQKEPVTTVLK